LGRQLYPVWEGGIDNGSGGENNLRFAGQYFDEETGLHYNYFRYYDPQTGRYTQSDPIGLGDGPNTYGYAYQNPIIYTDPNGLSGILGFLRPYTKIGNGRVALPRKGETLAQMSRRQDALNNLQALGRKAEILQSLKKDGLKPDNLNALGRLIKQIDNFSDLLGIAPLSINTGYQCLDPEMEKNKQKLEEALKEYEEAFNQCIASGWCV